MMNLKGVPANLWICLKRFFTGGSHCLWMALPGGILVCLLLASAPLLLAGQGTQAGAQSAPAVSSAAKAAIVHKVPAGTVLYLRLKTPVSTTSSNLGGSVEAEVERQVLGSNGVAIPLGAVVSGRIAKLIPSSSPTDRAMLLLQFDKLKLPGQKPIAVHCHVSNVDNAREKVLANGTIQGVLASELPVTLLNSALAKLQKKTSAGGQPASQSGGTWFGSPDTAINYPAGTEFSVVLDKALETTGDFKPEFASQIPANLKEVVTRLIADAPRRVASKKGNLGGPVNLVLVGSLEEIRMAFDKAGWTVAQDKNANSLWKTFEAVVKGQGYDAAPMSTLYVYGRPEEMAFEKMLNTFTMRHHLRIWKAPMTSPDGRQIWLVAADHDNGFDIRPGVISHSVDPHVDLERAKVGADLGMTGFVYAEELFTPPNPVHSGMTATGGEWESDGRILVIDLKPQSKLPATARG